jgi:hypothetical protein
MNEQPKHKNKPTWKRPDGTEIKTPKEIVNELNALLARAEKAEAALESAQKMCDHWEAKAAKRQRQVNEWKARAEKSEAELSRFMNMPSCSPELFLRSAQRTEKPAPIDWQRVRIAAAIAAMQSLMPDLRELSYSTKWVVQRADALVAELKKEEEA